MTTIDLRAEVRRRAVAVPVLPHLTESARATWRGRMVNEYASSRVFEALAAQMHDAGLDPAAVAACHTFAREEREHGILCGTVVEALGGEAAAPDRDDPPFPRHADVAPREGVLRNVLSVSCLSETVAVSLIGAERLMMPEGELRALLTRIWADEVGHARFGWRLATKLLPTLEAEQRRRLGAYLAVAFAHLEEHELAHLPVDARPPPEGTALGLCSGADARRLFYSTIEEVIVPQLDGLGLGASEAWRGRRRPADRPSGRSF